MQSKSSVTSVDSNKTSGNDDDVVFVGVSFEQPKVKQEPLSNQDNPLSIFKTEANDPDSGSSGTSIETLKTLSDARLAESAVSSLNQENTRCDLNRLELNTPNSIASEDLQSEASSTISMPDFLRSSPEMTPETGQRADLEGKKLNKKPCPPRQETLKKIVIGGVDFLAPNLDVWKIA